MTDPLAFLISAPRSGSTLLARMLGAHSQVFAPAEPHLMPPLAHLGFHERVDAAPYDPLITQQGLRELVALLPDGESDYLAALRSCTDQLYGKALAQTGRRIFLDKTPAYALVLDFLAKLYPDARYVVLTRHPMAIWSSVIDSFYDGDHEEAHRHNPILERYVPAIARFLEEAPAPILHVQYESLVGDPQHTMESICAFLDLPFEASMIDYGAAASAPPATTARGLGDPITVGRESRPTTASVDKWVGALAGHPERVPQCREIAAKLGDSDLRQFGTTGSELRKALAGIPTDGPSPTAASLTRYGLERRLLVAGRRAVRHHAFLARWVRLARSACDVLLR